MSSERSPKENEMLNELSRAIDEITTRHGLPNARNMFIIFNMTDEGFVTYYGSNIEFAQAVELTRETIDMMVNERTISN